MKNSKMKFLLSILLLPACTQAVESQENEDISINLMEADDMVVMSVSTTSDKLIEIQNATVLSALPDDPGLTLIINDSSGKKFDRCAMINPAYRSGEFPVSAINSERPISHSFEIASLARQYCLNPGVYVIRVLLKQRDRTYSSKRISFTARRP